MALHDGDQRDNPEFKFLELRKVKVADRVDAQAAIAAADKAGLVFAVAGKDIKAIAYDKIFDFQWSKNIINQAVDADVLAKFSVPFQPGFISVSLANQNVLVVSGTDSGGNLQMLFYNIDDIKLSRSGTAFAQLSVGQKGRPISIVSLDWQPEYGDSLFVAVLSDGSLVSVGVNTTTRQATILCTYLDRTEATSVSWSPKGKQLILGKANGCVTFYKHNNGTGFTEARNIAPPEKFKTYKVSSIKWVQSAMLFVTYMNPNDDNDPDTNYMFVTAPTKAMPEYYNYATICMNMGTYSKADTYRSDVVQIGNVIICSSTHSSEVGVVGAETTSDQSQPTSWSQFILDDNARIELPMNAGDDSFPRGLSFAKSTPKIYSISETEKYGGRDVPCLFVLTTSGLICPYVVINKNGGIVFPPLLPQNQLQFQANAPAQPVLPPPAADSIAKPPAPVAFRPVAPITQEPSSLSNLAATKDLSGQSSFTAVKEAPAPPPVSIPKPVPVQAPLRPVAATVEAPKPIETAPSKPKETRTEDDHDTYLQAAFDEVTSFNKEFKTANDKTRKILSLTLGDLSEIKKLSLKTQELNEVMRVAQETMGELVEDVDVLNGYLLETFGQAEEARSRLDRTTDPRYKELLRKRALNPAAAKKLAEIRKRKDYIEEQLREANRVLDEQWYEYTKRSKSKQNRKEIEPEAEAPLALIYRTLSDNAKTLRLLKQQINYLEREAGLENSMVLLDISCSSPANNSKIETSPENRALQNSIRQSKSSLREAVLGNSKIDLHVKTKDLVRIQQMPIEKRHCIQAFVDQLQKVPVRKPTIPQNICESKFISASSKAKTKATIDKSQLATLLSPSPPQPQPQSKTITPVLPPPPANSIAKPPTIDSTTANPPVADSISKPPAPIAFRPVVAPITPKAPPVLPTLSSAKAGPVPIQSSPIIVKESPAPPPVPISIPKPVPVQPAIRPVATSVEAPKPVEAVQSKPKEPTKTKEDHDTNLQTAFDQVSFFGQHKDVSTPNDKTQKPTSGVVSEIKKLPPQTQQSSEPAKVNQEPVGESVEAVPATPPVPTFGGMAQQQPQGFGAVTPIRSPFGGGGTFGSSPTFGSTPPARTFGSPAANSDQPTFGSLASSTPALPFGGLASSKPAPSFGAMAQPQPQALGAMGTGQTVFGGGATFGSSPTFGSTSPGRTFGSTMASTDQPTFGSLASNTPGLSFGALASSTPVQSFGAIPQQPQGFGSLATGQSVFGGGMNAQSTFGSVSPGQSLFGGSSPPTGFGALAQAASPSFGGASFTQRRM